MAKKPQVGEQAPDFELPGTDGTFRLSEHRGERVVLLFYPGDNTPVCTKQFCSYRDRAEDFAALNATVVGISAQDLDSHEAFAAKHSLNVPLLADVDKRGGRHTDAAGALGVKRAVIVIDEEGIVRHRHDHLLGLDFQSVDELKAVLDTLPRRVAGRSERLRSRSSRSSRPLARPAPHRSRRARAACCAAFSPGPGASRCQRPVTVEFPGALVVGEGALERVEQLGPQSSVSTGTASSTRWSRLRGIRSAEAM